MLSRLVKVRENAVEFSEKKGEMDLKQLADDMFTCFARRQIRSLAVTTSSQSLSEELTGYIGKNAVQD